MAPTGQRPLLKDILGARMMIMWEEQLVDPPIAYVNISVLALKLHSRASCNVLNTTVPVPRKEQVLPQGT